MEQQQVASQDFWKAMDEIIHGDRLPVTKEHVGKFLALLQAQHNTGGDLRRIAIFQVKKLLEVAQRFQESRQEIEWAEYFLGDYTEVNNWILWGVVIEILGEPAPTPCEHCSKRSSTTPFQRCITLDGYVKGICNNCCMTDHVYVYGFKRQDQKRNGNTIDTSQEDSCATEESSTTPEASPRSHISISDTTFTGSGSSHEPETSRNVATLLHSASTGVADELERVQMVLAESEVDDDSFGDDVALASIEAIGKEVVGATQARTMMRA